MNKKISDKDVVDYLMSRHNEQKEEAAPPPPKEEKPIKKTISYDVLKIGLIIAGVIIAVTGAFAGYAIIKTSEVLNQEQSLLVLVYILGSGWLFVILSIIPFFIARREIWNEIKCLGRKGRVVRLRLVGGDTNEVDVIVSLKGNTMEVGESKIIINPKRTTMKNGVRVLTYVADNALAHDFFQDQKETLKQIGDRMSKQKAEDFHDIFSDPIRIDAKYFNETFLAAQQTNPDILKKIIAFLTSKNVIIMLGAIAIAAAAAAFFSLQANNVLNTIPICNPTTITP